MAPRKEDLELTGEWDNPTVSALQRSLGGLIVEGALDRGTVIALQHRLNADQTGTLDAATITALQKRLRVKQTGIGNQTTIKALQKRLIAGTF